MRDHIHTLCSSVAPVSAYMDELRAITEAREAFNERTRALHEARGVPSSVPLVATPDDEELQQYITDGKALVARERAFDEKFLKSGVDPQTIA